MEIIIKCRATVQKKNGENIKNSGCSLPKEPVMTICSCPVYAESVTVPITRKDGKPND